MEIYRTVMSEKSQEAGREGKVRRISVKKQDQKRHGEVTLHSDRDIRREGKRRWKEMMKHTQ